MMRSCSEFLSKVVSALLVMISLGVHAQDPSHPGVLFYSVKNVSTEWSSTRLEKTNSSEDIQKYLRQDASSKKEVKDAFLIPAILNLVVESTHFETLYEFKDRNKIKSRNKQADEHLLLISLNTFGDLIEYQFRLSDFNDGVYELVRESSFFIDPRNQGYDNILKREVQLIFNGPLGVNKPPVPQIRLDGQMVNKQDHQVFYRSNRDSIFLDGLSSEDDNTPKKYLEYKWRVEKKGEPNAFIRDFSFEQGQQSLVINEPGIYTFYLDVSDGVAWSNDSNAHVTIHIIVKSELELHKGEEYIIQNSLFRNRKRSFINLKDPISFNIRNYQQGTVFRFTYIDSQTRNQKYFLNAQPEVAKNSLELRFHEAGRRDTNEYFTPLSGIYVDTARLQNPGIIHYHLGSDISPGVHTFTLNTEYKGIESDKDTVNIAYHEKSALSFSLGLVIYDILQGGEYDSRINLTSAKFGFRTYITPRVSADLDVLFPNQAQNEVFGDSSFSIHSFVFKLNYDLFPFGAKQINSGESFAYLTLFASFQQLIITSTNEDTDKQMIGFGIKPRMQLFKHNKKLGAMYLEGEIGYQAEPRFGGSTQGSHFESWFFGASLIYGFLDY